MTDFKMPQLNGGERVYRALRYLYPARFRRAFKQDLIETLRDERRNASQSGVSASAFWLMTLRDVMTQGTSERMASAARFLRRLVSGLAVVGEMPTRPLERAGADPHPSP